MAECLRGRLSNDFRYVNCFLEMFSLVKEGNLHDEIDQMLSKLILSLSNLDASCQFKENTVKLDCLRMVLLSKFQLLEIEGTLKTSGIGSDCYRCIIRLCVFGFNELCPTLNCDILEITLWLVNDDDIFEFITDLLNMCKRCLDSYLVLGICTYEGADISPSNLLNLIETTVNVLSKKYFVKNITSDRFLEFQKVLNSDDILIKLALNDYRILSIQTLTRILPLIADLPYGVLLLEKLWVHLKHLWKGENWEEVNYNKVYLVLCSLASQFFPNDIPVGSNDHINLIKENKFWEIILFGIGQRDSLRRKQSRFLLRKALDFATHNSGSVCMHLSTGLFFWHKDQSTELIKIWEDYFLILEALEEKQVHLIEPVLVTFENCFLSNHNLCISPAWNLPIFQRMFSHDSNSIVKCGLRLFFFQDLDFYSSPIVNTVSFLLHPLLQTLNNTHLYIKQKNNEFEVENGLKKLFSSVINLSNEICDSFFSQILVRMCEIPWGPVPLFYLIRALSSLTPNKKVWEVTSFKIIKLFLTNTLQTHSVCIRGAIQSCVIKALVNFVNTEQLDLFYLTDIIGTFCREESLRRGSDSWNIIVEWLKKIMDQEKAHNFISISLSQLIDLSVGKNSKCYVNIKAFARMCILLFDASFILVGTETDQIKTFCCTMYPLFKHFQSVESRMYVSNTSLDHGIEVLNNIIEESNDLSEDDITHRVIISAAANLLEGVILYYRRRLFFVTNIDDYNSINLYLNALYTFSNEKKLLPCLLKTCEGLVEDAFHVLELKKDVILCKYFGIKILCWLAYLFLDNECLFQSTLLSKSKIQLSSYVKSVLAQGNLNKNSDVKFTNDSPHSRDLHALKGHLTSEYAQSHWSLLYFHLKIDSKYVGMLLSLRNIDLLMVDAIESIEIGGREVLSPVMSVLKILLPSAMENSFELTIEFCSVCWKATFEQRKTEFFWVAIEKFIKMLFQAKIMLMPHCEKHILKYTQDLYSHGQTAGRIYSIFINHLYDETFKFGPFIWRIYYSILVEALAFGPVLRKDQRIYKDTCQYIQSFGPQYTVNLSQSCEYFSDTSVRVKGIALLLFIMKTESENGKDGSKTTIEQLADLLWKNVSENSRERSRYYGNSQAHRLKQRAMQSLLLLEVSLNEEKCEHLMVSLCDSLLIESHQPSVKYLQEWLLVRILIHHSSLRGKMWKHFQQVGLKRTGCMSSFIAVAYHLAISLSLSRVEQEQFIMECMHHIHPWCMAQQFNVRLYAQVVLQKLWDIIVKQNFQQAMKEYHVVYQCLNSGIDQGGNIQKNFQKLKENFYFDVFHPVIHFSIETIYYDIPRLANVSSEEWISTSDFDYVELHSLILLKNTDSHLREHSAGEWVLKPIASSAHLEKNVSMNVFSSCQCKASDSSAEMLDGKITPLTALDNNINMQKKIMPWKYSMPQPDTVFSMEESEIEWHRNHRRGFDQGRGGLVVVASLIDRTPNLGGLCRTCEAFGVSEYVLGSLKYVDDRQFQNLSVSAERWIPITEVKPFMLASYLKSMKEKGYSLIGAEQTASSVTLNEFKFPEKSLLLLGNEKDGVPADLLPLLDMCVEVPQQGLIRSLNVHVTGAIFVWEYLRQHSSSSNR